MTLLQWEIWIRLGTRSRRAIRREFKKYGKPYRYTPRGDLLENLESEMGIPREQVYRELLAIRQEILGLG
jgi:hypothetical protein